MKHESLSNSGMTEQYIINSMNKLISVLKDPLKLTPVSQIADIADKFTRNEIASPNEMRAAIGWTPSQDPAADELRNRNINQANAELDPGMYEEEYPEEEAYDEEY